MSGKSDSSPGKKQDQKPKVTGRESQAGFDPGAAAYESLLASGGQSIESIHAFLDNADEASRVRVVNELQQTHGNGFVQRMVAQRQAHRPGGTPTIEADRTQLGGNIPQPGTEGEHEENTAEDWAQWLGAAKSGAKSAISVFATSCQFKDIIVNTSIAVGGELTGPSLAPLIQVMMMGSQAPLTVASAFGRAANAAWQDWISDVSVPGLPWYPSFISWPGPMAPPTPNVPMPLITISPGASIDGGGVASDIRSRLGERGEEPEAQQAADDFGAWLSSGFTIWHLSTQVMNVFGKGPVPTWSPPYVPVGPVIQGDAFGTGVLVGPAFPD